LRRRAGTPPRPLTVAELAERDSTPASDSRLDALRAARGPPPSGSRVRRRELREFEPRTRRSDELGNVIPQRAGSFLATNPGRFRNAADIEKHRLQACTALDAPKDGGLWSRHRQTAVLARSWRAASPSERSVVLLRGRRLRPRYRRGRCRRSQRSRCRPTAVRRTASSRASGPSG
jgi:hypothetical protein